MRDFLGSLRLVKGLCRTGAEARYLEEMERIARLSKASPVDGNPNLPVLVVQLLMCS